ncbi:hypothetical protein PT974_10386 [Cladobotryum mycophilum]|uniref:Uncharacterized protein n=1 Tax=Cladobotryum mycophilum TaxID=491253 RepID=A0ABR0S9P9_9HYPO
MILQRCLPPTQPRFCVQQLLPKYRIPNTIQAALMENPKNYLLRSISAPLNGSIVPLRGFGPNSIPRPGETIDVPHIGLYVGKLWENSKTLGVRFPPRGSSQYANVWSENANVYFDFVESDQSAI